MNAHFNEIKKSLGTIKGRVEARNAEVKELKQRLDTLDENAKRGSRVTASGPSGVERFCRDLNLSGKRVSPDGIGDRQNLNLSKTILSWTAGCKLG